MKASVFALFCIVSMVMAIPYDLTAAEDNTRLTLADVENDAANVPNAAYEDENNNTQDVARSKRFILKKLLLKKALLGLG